MIILVTQMEIVFVIRMVIGQCLGRTLFLGMGMNEDDRGGNAEDHEFSLFGVIHLQPDIVLNVVQNINNQCIS